ncbi:MAG: DUF502 domain-containing protein [Phycisphaerae bacterium]|nr:DUF502 domain-containing protein [Phycisphaerae bacterium]
MKKQLRIFLAGMLVLTPLAATVYVIWWGAGMLDRLGGMLVGDDFDLPTGVGALIILAGVYLVGLLTHWWAFRGLFALIEGVLTRLPGIRTVYESVRDLMQLFGGKAESMGRAVEYRPPGSGLSILGILTNDNPMDRPTDHPDRKVAVYLPYSYMFGGPTIYASPAHVREVDMSVEQVLKVCTTAHTARSAVIRPKAEASD